MLTEAETEKLYKIAYDLRLAFSLRGELGKNGAMVYDVRLKRDADNFYRQSYKSSDHESYLMCQEIAKLLKLGIFETSPCSYVQFCSPALLIAKSDKSAQLVTDYRLSTKTVQLIIFPSQVLMNSWPKLVCQLQCMHHCRFFFFFQISLTLESKG